MTQAFIYLLYSHCQVNLFSN